MLKNFLDLEGTVLIAGVDEDNAILGISNPKRQVGVVSDFVFPPNGQDQSRQSSISMTGRERLPVAMKQAAVSYNCDVGLGPHR